MNGLQRSSRPSQAGFTLIELMIVVVIIAILAAIAVPAYNDQVRKTRRSTGKAAIMSNVQALERFNTVNRTFLGFPCVSNTPQYTITCTNLAVLTYTVTATPLAGTDQVKDRCGALSVTQTGARTIAGAATGVTVADCW